MNKNTTVTNIFGSPYPNKARDLNYGREIILQHQQPIPYSSLGHILPKFSISRTGSLWNCSSRIGTSNFSSSSWTVYRRITDCHSQSPPSQSPRKIHVRWDQTQPPSNCWNWESCIFRLGQYCCFLFWVWSFRVGWLSFYRLIVKRQIYFLKLYNVLSWPNSWFF